MKLYKFDWGVYPRRVLLYLRERGINGIEMVDVDPLAGENLTPAFRKLNPAATVPVLVTNDGGLIRHSLSIIEYLETSFPSGSLMGATPEAVANTRDLLRLIDEAYGFNLMCTMYGSPLMQQRRAPSVEVARVMRFEAIRLFALLEEMAGDRPYLGGEEPSVADVVFVVSEQYYRSLYELCLPTSCGSLEAIYRRFAQRPSMMALDPPSIVAELAPVRGVEGPLQTVEGRAR